jgi:molybdopterin converting factor small subunit
MAVIIKLFGNLRIITGRKEIALDWEDDTLASMISCLASQYGEEIKEELLDAHGELDRAYVIFIKGERVDDLSTRIKDGEEIVITSMLAGGNEQLRRFKQC